MQHRLTLLRSFIAKYSRTIGILLFGISIFFISLTIDFPDYLKPEGYWFSTYSIQGHIGDNFIFKFVLHAPEVESRSTKLVDYYTYQLDLIQYSFVPDRKNQDKAPDRVCIDKLIVSQHVPFGENLLQGFSPLCRNVEKNSNGFYNWTIDIFSITKEPIEALVTPEFNSFYYPFVRNSDLVVFQVIYHTIHDGLASETKTVIPGLDVLIDDKSNWDIDLNDLNYSLPSNLEGNASFIHGDAVFIETNIAGPLYFQALSLFLIFGMISLIALTFLIETTSSFTQAVAGILFGLFGIRQILTPQSIQAKTILDVVFIFLYAFVAYTILDHFLVRAIRSRQYGNMDRQLVTTISSRTFHILSCVYLHKIPEDRLIYLKDQEDAKKRNLKSCKRCLGRL